MTTTVEDALEILAGIKPRLVNIRIDYNEKALIKSIAKQVNNKIALTDRQLDLSLKKISKYKDGLIKNNVDAELLLSAKPLRMSLREIDRSLRVYITPNSKYLTIKYAHSKMFAELWTNLKQHLIGDIKELSQVKEVSLNETNILNVVRSLQDHKFNIDAEVLSIYDEITSIINNPLDYVPYVSLDEQGTIVVKNNNKQCAEYIANKIVHTENNLAYISKLKSCGIFYKDQSIVDLINNSTATSKAKESLISFNSRFKIDSEQYPFDCIVEIIKDLDQWPVLILLEDDNKALAQLKTAHDSLKHCLDPNQITVFFRLDNKHSTHKEFNQFVKDNALNNYIGEHTKVVFIAKTKIPKPLLKADWHPHTAIVMSNYEFGRTSAFLDDFSTIYYYNSSILLKHNRIKGTRSIVQL